MHIYSNGTGSTGPEITRTTPTTSPTQPASASEPRAGSGAPATRGTDKVEISDAGRALVAQGTGTNTGELDQVRAARIHAQVLSGAYDSLDVVDTVARRLISSGDL